MQGRQDILFRGHRDRRRLFSNDITNDENDLNNEGDFRDLIRFRVESGDNLLKKKLRELKSACYKCYARHAVNHFRRDLEHMADVKSSSVSEV
ncbi:unnamed protein product [Acanthoscelides obtectus]|uniref:Uncharacterized protein n=1 Tax=Acanthoscelides obtectus TaxID=200917 RepID=A0A9P0KCL7_ACAOB|nr:unnamed protein product [Acanthoscelides obtectus]CAK1622815.1 hypothetical protein AOBTE_LOCUS1679 [Acanthoscelides obtectus]